MVAERAGPGEKAGIKRIALVTEARKHATALS